MAKLPAAGYPAGMPNRGLTDAEIEHSPLPELYALLERENVLAQVRALQKIRKEGEIAPSSLMQAVTTLLRAADVVKGRGGEGEVDEAWKGMAKGLSPDMQQKLAAILGSGGIPVPEELS